MAQTFFLAVAALGLSFGVAFGVTPISGKLARRFNILDHPHTYKKHREATPYLGGLAIMVSWLISMGFLFLLSLLTEQRPVAVSFVPLVCAIALGLLGLFDDVRSLPAAPRLAAHVTAAAATWAAGLQVSILPSPTLNFLLTIIWIVGITNAFNLLDNMDGLTAGLSGIAAFSFAIMAIAGGFSTLSIVAAALAGAALGFVTHNRHPAKIFMGDSGSTFLGYLLAVIGIHLRFDNLVQVTFLVPVVVLGLPILDTTIVLFSRWRHGRPLFQGGRDHISHRLVAAGLPVPAAVGFLCFSSVCLGWLGLVISRANAEIGFMLLALVMALGVFFGLLLLRVPVYEEAAGAEESKREPRQNLPRSTGLVRSGIRD
ncbi:MAG: MraY family glycosyltransferase [Actinomycetota bacterium]